MCVIKTEALVYIAFYKFITVSAAGKFAADRFGFRKPAKTVAYMEFHNLGYRKVDREGYGTLFLIGCNAGHQDYRYTNVAAAFAGKVNGAPVLASDGTVRHKIGETYRSENDDGEFQSWLGEENLERDNEGWLVYQQTESGLKISGSKGKELTSSEMIQISDYYNLLQCV